MENILIVAYFFPPSGGGGVQRTSKFVKYLYKNGFNPIVLTVNENNYNVKDFSLMNDINQDIKIYRVSNLKDYNINIGKRKLNINNHILIPDSAVIWQYKVRSLAKKVILKNNIKVIYTTAGPYSTHLLGLYLKKSLRVNWIADFRDEWTTHPRYITNKLIYYNRPRVCIEKNMEKRVCNYADTIITISDIMSENLARNNQVDKSKFTVIPNGYDEDDFKNIEFKKDKSIFTITYTGSFNGFCKPTNFLKAISNLIKKQVIERKSICINFIGNYSDWIYDMVNEYGLNDIVNIYKYVDHIDSVRFLCESDVLLLVIPNAPNANSIYTGKIFEYLRAKRMILALVPKNGIAAKLIKSTKSGVVCDNEDINEIQENITNIYREFMIKGKIKVNSDENKIRKYSRENLTKDLIKVIEELL